MQPKSLAATMFDLQLAINNCERSGNSEWLAKHRENLRAVCKLLPSGSGIDNGTTLVEIFTATKECIVLSCSYHHMNDQGSYDGWTEHKITVTPSFNGLNIKISGPDRNEIKEYLHDVYTHALLGRVIWRHDTNRWVHELTEFNPYPERVS